MSRSPFCGQATVLVLLACLVQAPFLAHLRTLTDQPPDYRTYLACSTSREVLQFRVDEKVRIFSLTVLAAIGSIVHIPVPQVTGEGCHEARAFPGISGIWVFFPGRSPPISC